MGKPPVLLLPGTLCTPAVFEHQARALAACAPCVETVRFTTQDSITAMAELAITLIPPKRAAVVVGFSMGGMVAMEIYRRAPQRVAKLALLNTNPHADLPLRKTSRDLQLHQARQVGLEQVVRQRLLPNYLYRSTTAIEKLIVGMAIELGVDCYAAQSEALATRVDSTATLQSITCPTTILGGAQDPLCPPEVQTHMQSLVPGSELRVVDKCGHFSCLEQADEVSATLLEWYLGS